jgi:hypothetical protein
MCTSLVLPLPDLPLVQVAPGVWCQLPGYWCWAWGTLPVSAFKNREKMGFFEPRMNPNGPQTRELQIYLLFLKIIVPPDFHQWPTTKPPGVHQHDYVIFFFLALENAAIFSCFFGSNIMGM